MQKRFHAIFGLWAELLDPRSEFLFRLFIGAAAVTKLYIQIDDLLLDIAAKDEQIKSLEKRNVEAFCEMSRIKEELDRYKSVNSFAHQFLKYFEERGFISKDNS